MLVIRPSALFQFHLLNNVTRYNTLLLNAKRQYFISINSRMLLENEPGPSPVEEFLIISDNTPNVNCQKYMTKGLSPLVYQYSVNFTGFQIMAFWAIRYSDGARLLSELCGCSLLR